MGPWGPPSKTVRQQDNGRCRVCDVIVVSRLGGASPPPHKFSVLVITKRKWATAMHCAWMCPFLKDIRVVVGAKFVATLPPQAWNSHLAGQHGTEKSRVFALISTGGAAWHPQKTLCLTHLAKQVWERPSNFCLERRGMTCLLCIFSSLLAWHRLSASHSQQCILSDASTSLINVQSSFVHWRGAINLLSRAEARFVHAHDFDMP